MVPLPMKIFAQALPTPFVPVACGSSTTNSSTTTIIGSTPQLVVLVLYYIKK